jgi:hypothetical protein
MLTRTTGTLVAIATGVFLARHSTDTLSGHSGENMCHHGKTLMPYRSRDFKVETSNKDGIRAP